MQSKDGTIHQEFARNGLDTLCILDCLIEILSADEMLVAQVELC